MNGYDAQDMASQGADGFRNGYQAGYADAVNAIEAAQPAAAQEAVAWQVGDEFYPSESLAIEAIQQWGPSDAIAIPLYAAASVTAAPVEVIRDDDGEIVMVKQGGKIIASTCHAGGKSPAAPGIDLREIGEAMAQAEQHVETLHSLCSRPSVLACIKRLRKAQASLIDSGPKGALPTLPDDFSESKDWRAGSYGERVVWLMDTVRSQREHIAALLGSPKGATLNEQFGSAEGLGTSEVLRVADHMAQVIDYIGKQYPNATMLDRGPILRNIRRWEGRLRAALADSPKGGSDEAGIPEPNQECYSDNDGDSWYDHPADAEFVEGLAVGETYTLTVSHYSVERTYRVTKVPDDVSDDYEVEPVQATSTEAQAGDAEVRP